MRNRLGRATNVAGRRGPKATSPASLRPIEAPRVGPGELGDRLLERGHELPARPLRGPEPRQVLRVDLAVDEGDAPAQELLREGHERHLGGVGDAREPRLSEERGAERYPV